MSNTEKKDKIAVRSRYFKKSQVDAETGHVMRLFATNKNAIESLTHENFGSSDEEIQRNYKNAESKMYSVKDKSNTLLDSVLVLPLEQFEVMRSEHENWKELISESVENIMNDIEAEQGFKPLGWQMHLDEGTEHDDGTVTLNPHVHMLFANYCDKDIVLTQKSNRTMKDANGKAIKDPKNPRKYLYERDEDGNVIKDEKRIDIKGKMPLQYHRGRGDDSAWARHQTLGFERLKPYGFKRGESKVLTQKKHQDKAEWTRTQAIENEKRALEAEEEAKRALREKSEALSELACVQIENKRLTEENEKIAEMGDKLKLENLTMYSGFKGLETYSKGIVMQSYDLIQRGIAMAVDAFGQMKMKTCRSLMMNLAEVVEDKVLKQSPNIRMGMRKVGDTSIVEPLRESDEEYRKSIRPKMGR